MLIRAYKIVSLFLAAVFADEFDKTFYSLFFGNILLDTLLGLVERDFTTSGTYVTVVGIGHLTRTIYDTAHDTYLQAYHVLGGSFNLGDGFLQIVERTTATWARDILGLGKLDTGSLQNGVRKLYQL